MPGSGRVGLDIAAQAHDEAVHDARARVRAQPPDLLQELASGHGLALALYESAQQPGLARGEPHDALGSLQLEAVEVDRGVADGDRSRRVGGAGHAVPAPASQQASHARQQLVELERLGQVVVGALLQAAHEILGGVLRRQDQDRHQVAGSARAAGYLEAAHARQHQVEEHEVEATLRLLEPRRAQLIGALLKVESDAELARIAVELFGVNLEEVSDPRHAFEIIKQALALETVSGSADEAAQAFEGTASEWDKMSRHVSTGAAELGERLAEVFNYLADTSDWEETTARIEESERKFKGLAEGAAELRAELEETGEIAKRGGGGVRYFADEVDAAAAEVQELDAALSEFAGRFDSDRIFRSLAEDIDKLAASTEKLTASSYDLATGFDTSTAAGRSAEAAAESLSGNLDVLAQKYINGEITAGQFRSGQAQVESALRSVAGQMGLNQAETAALIAKYAEVPSDIQTRADLDASPAWNEALRLKGQLDSLDGRTTTSSSNHYINTFKTTFYRADRQAAGGWGNAAGGAGIAAAAAGGIPAAAGGGLGIPTLVNERGAESARLPDGDVVSLPTGSTVFTAEDTAARFSGAGSGGSSGGPPVYNFHFHGGVITDRDIEAKFRDIVYRGGLDGLGGVN